VRTEAELAKPIVAIGPASGGAGRERFGGGAGGAGNDGMKFACEARFGGGVGTGMGAAPDDGVGRAKGCATRGADGCEPDNPGACAEAPWSATAIVALIEHKNKPTKKAGPEGEGENFTARFLRQFTARR
jgi:hypothetical protein